MATKIFGTKLETLLDAGFLEDDDRSIDARRQRIYRFVSGQQKTYRLSEIQELAQLLEKPFGLTASELMLSGLKRTDPDAYAEFLASAVSQVA